ncbi:MAG: hypothetical protein V1495_09475 [Pseudomonadota bacterium]
MATGRAGACASNSAGKCARSFLKTASNVYATIREGTGIASVDQLLPNAKKLCTGHQSVYGLISGMAVVAIALLLI